MPFVTLISSSQPEGFMDFLEQLLALSCVKGVLLQSAQEYGDWHKNIATPRKAVVSISSLADVQAHRSHKEWPYWPSRDAIFLGSLDAKEMDLGVKLPFLNCANPERTNGDFDGFCREALTHWDWVLLQYANMYSFGGFTFITKKEKLYHWVNHQLPDLRIAMNYKSGKTTYKDLRCVTFSDDDAQWLAPVVLAKERGEPEPLVLCQIEKDGVSYGFYDNDLDEWHDDVPWYEVYTQILPLVDSFEDRGTIYELRRVTNIEVYHQLWARVSLDRNIVFDVFSGDCDPQDIRAYIEQKYSDRESVNGKGSWHYWTSYGGGADEHYGSFYASDAAFTQQLWESFLPERRAALFDGIHASTFKVGYGETGELPLVFAKEKQEGLPLLLCQMHHILNYGEYSWDEGGFLKSSVWFEPYTEQLKLVAAFSHEKAAYQLFAVADLEAFKVLWSAQPGKRSMVRNIAIAVLAADCNIEKLKEITATESFHFFPERLQGIASWEYIRLPEELHMFHALDAKWVQEFEMLRYDQKNRGKRVQAVFNKY